MIRWSLFAPLKIPARHLPDEETDTWNIDSSRLTPEPFEHNLLPMELRVGGERRPTLHLAYSDEIRLQDHPRPLGEEVAGDLHRIRVGCVDDRVDESIARSHEDRGGAVVGVQVDRLFLLCRRREQEIARRIEQTFECPRDVSKTDETRLVRVTEHRRIDTVARQVQRPSGLDGDFDARSLRAIQIDRPILAMEFSAIVGRHLMTVPFKLDDDRVSREAAHHRPSDNRVSREAARHRLGKWLVGPNLIGRTDHVDLLPLFVHV